MSHQYIRFGSANDLLK